jgi:hypothetical protein
MKLTLLTSALVLPTFVLPAVAAGAASFRTPGRAAYCGLTEGEHPGGLICWTPSDGFSIGMGAATSRPDHAYNPVDRGYHEDAAPVLGFGKSWRFHSVFRCTSRSTGLTCTNRAGHGWWLGRHEGYRVF